MITTTVHGREEEQRLDQVEKARWLVTSHRFVATKIVKIIDKISQIHVELYIYCNGRTVINHYLTVFYCRLCGQPRSGLVLDMLVILTEPKSTLWLVILHLEISLGSTMRKFPKRPIYWTPFKIIVMVSSVKCKVGGLRLQKKNNIIRIRNQSLTLLFLLVVSNICVHNF